MGGEGQGRNHDGRGVGHRAHLLLQIHPKKKNKKPQQSTCRKILTEHLLNAGKRPQIFKGQENLHITEWGKGKRKQIKKVIRMGPTLVGGNCTKKRFLHPRKSSHQQGEQPGWRGI